MSNLLDALEGGKHNISCLRYILFLRNCLDLTERLQYVIMCARAKEKDDREIAVSLPPDAIPINFTPSYYIKNTNLSRLFTGYRVHCSKILFDERTRNDYK